MSLSPTLFTTKLEEDPITHRLVSRRCWNTLHQDRLDADAHRDCQDSGCNCACHDWQD